MLWDREMGSALPRIAALPPERRYAAGVTAIERTLASFDPPADPDEPDTRLLLQCLRDSRAAVGGDYTGRVLPDGAEEQMTSIVADSNAAGIPQLVMAVANCYGLPESGMAPEHFFTILSDCYSAVVDREEVDDEDIDEELANPLCVATIEWQRELVNG